MANVKIGELLIKAGVLQESQLKAALAEQQKWGGKLGEILVRMNLVVEDVVVRTLAKQLGIPFLNLDAVQGIPPHVKAKIPAETARDYTVLPVQLRDEGKTLAVAMTDAQNVELLDRLRAMTKCRIMPHLAGRTAIARAFTRFYEGEADLSDFEGSFKVVDAQGRTMVKSLKEIEAAAAAKAQPAAAPPPPAPARKPATVSLSEIEAAPAPKSAASPLELLKTVEEVQRKEVAAIKAMVDLMIEKGVFTREDYLAKVKR